jgi:peptide/nickel transport system permease protein
VLTYVARRLLYSVAVLIAASFLVFFFVTVSGDPIAGLRITPNVSRESIAEISDRKHLDDPIPVRVHPGLDRSSDTPSATPSFRS